MSNIKYFTKFFKESFFAAWLVSILRLLVLFDLKIESPNWLVLIVSTFTSASIILISFTLIALISMWLFIDKLELDLMEKLGEKIGTAGELLGELLDNVIVLTPTLIILLAGIYYIPTLLYPALLNIIVRASHLDINALFLTGSIILGDIASIISIYEFLKKRQRK